MVSEASFFGPGTGAVRMGEGTKSVRGSLIGSLWGALRPKGKHSPLERKTSGTLMVYAHSPCPHFGSIPMWMERDMVNLSGCRGFGFWKDTGKVYDGLFTMQTDTQTLFSMSFALCLCASRPNDEMMRIYIFCVYVSAACRKQETQKSHWGSERTS